MNPCESYFNANQVFMLKMRDIIMSLIIKYMIRLEIYIIYLIIEDSMRRLDQETIKQTYKRLERGKIFTIDQLVLALKCSPPDARLKLAVESLHKLQQKWTILYSTPCAEIRSVWIMAV